MSSCTSLRRSRISNGEVADGEQTTRGRHRAAIATPTDGRNLNTHQREAVRGEPGPNASEIWPTSQTKQKRRTVKKFTHEEQAI